MLGFADYVIIMLVVLGMVAACRHIWRSWRNGSCPGCGCCKKDCCSCGCSKCH